MDKDVYYDIPIFQNLYSFVPEKNTSSKKDLVDISIENIMQLEPYKNGEHLEMENKKKKGFVNYSASLHNLTTHSTNVPCFVVNCYGLAFTISQV